MTFSKSRYPWIGISKDSDAIVLFIANEKGVVLYVDSFYDSEQERFLAVEQDWHMPSFKKISKKECLLLKNKYGFPKLRVLKATVMKGDTTLDGKERIVLFISESKGVILSGYMEHDHGECYREDWISPTSGETWNKYKNKEGEEDEM